jgi:hypothetical protein
MAGRKTEYDKTVWADGYTSALANAREAGYITEEQYEDLYEEVIHLI